LDIMISESEAGVLLIDKPAGKTSFAIVRAVRQIFSIKKVGHAGTLDPFATGLLVVCLGRPATRLISSLMEGEKEYLATVHLGMESTTLDPEGVLSPVKSPQGIEAGAIDEVLARFRGTIMQTPPSYSALKHKGKPLYHYARKGITVEKMPRQVRIHQLRWRDRRALLTGAEPTVELLVQCGKGTYIRSLAADIGRALGCGAYLSALRRTRSGFFNVEDSCPGALLFDERRAAEIGEWKLSLEVVRKLLQSSTEVDNIPCSN
jgi:tRNA pseudouridine55 synthase